ncbi:23S rRNA (uracil1939-C5)-methyltransferase [Paenibacillus turicensis]|uniref:23S rRNA (Uracil1939-C5)-methyltransferase n=2 Tax=Paenibacillus turicensis TaxID=160487 RepID=A0ABS4FPN9_9BACL|nr:23S rRNA (uracil1939-C5)-methyltransferase [Paenibacillus turicensis]
MNKRRGNEAGNRGKSENSGNSRNEKNAGNAGNAGNERKVGNAEKAGNATKRQGQDSKQSLKAKSKVESKADTREKTKANGKVKDKVKTKGKTQGKAQVKNKAKTMKSHVFNNSKISDTVFADLPVAKNDTCVIEIIGMNHDGEGVGRVEGYTLFVSGALPGEQVEVKVLKTKKQYGYAKLLNVLQASPERVTPPCDIYEQCGGCQLQHLSYQGQLDWKRQHVIDALERIGKLSVAKDLDTDLATGKGEDTDTGLTLSVTASLEASLVDGVSEGIVGLEGIKVLPTLGMAEPWRYRNKAQVPIGVAPERSSRSTHSTHSSLENSLIGGFYAKGSHRIIDMETCLIQHEQNDDVIAHIKEIGRSLGIAPYNEETGQGLLRHVVVRIGRTTGEIMVVLVTNGDRIPKVEEWIQAITSQIPQVISVCQNVNTRRTNVIFGDVTRVLWGREVIYDYIGNVKFAISARSFYQVNPEQTEVLYQKTVEYAGLTGNETVIDAYCGIGTISLFLAQHAKKVYGVEIVPEAIEDARVNAELNDMSHVQFEVGASEDVIPRWREQGVEADVIVVDPPRKGCDAKLLETILEMKPKRVVYVSCNPATLARDLRVLEDGGYKAVEAQPVDMFPHTTHVECVVRLVRN